MIPHEGGGYVILASHLRLVDVIFVLFDVFIIVDKPVHTHSFVLMNKHTLFDQNKHFFVESSAAPASFFYSSPSRPRRDARSSARVADESGDAVTRGASRGRRAEMRGRVGERPDLEATDIAERLGYRCG